jgi:hypothetical protein
MVVISCNRNAKVEDTRDQNQLAFIRKVVSLEKGIPAAANEIVLDEYVDSAENALTKFTIDSLNRKFHSWTAEVIDISNDHLGYNVVKLDLMVKKDLSSQDEYPEFFSIMLTSLIDKSKKQLIDQLKSVQVGHTILISGTFMYKEDGLAIEARSTSLEKEDLIINPNISCQITDIALNNNK